MTKRNHCVSATGIHPILAKQPSSYQCPRASDFTLQYHHPIKQRLCRWRAAWNIDINRNNPIAPAYNRIGIVVIHRRLHMIPWKSHTVVLASDHKPCAAQGPFCWSTCPQQSSSQTDVGRRAALSQSVQGHSAPWQSASFHRTTGQAKCHPVQRPCARPIDDILGRG